MQFEPACVNRNARNAGLREAGPRAIHGGRCVDEDAAAAYGSAFPRATHSQAEVFAPMAESNASLPSSLADRLDRLERALDALDSALAARPAASAPAPASAQQAVLAELQGRVSRLVAHLEKALNVGAPSPGSPHAAD